MVQNWPLPIAGTAYANQALKNDIPNALESLRTCFAGDSEPASAARVADMLWFKASTKELFQRDRTNSAWIPQRRREITFGDVALAARTWRALRAATPIWVESIAILPSATTSTSVAASKEWTFLLKNQTTGLNLFSATPSTATTVSGVGGGELAADTGKVLTANQNHTLAAGELLYFVVGSVGAPTAVADVSFTITYWELGT